MEVINKLKKSKAGVALYTYLMDRDAIKSFRMVNDIRKNRPARDKIRVGFVCQYIPAWNKMKLVYHEMLMAPDFEPILICVPSDIDEEKLIAGGEKANDIYQYFVEHGYDAINAFTEDNTWLDFKALDMDYVFFSRPYNWYMPPCYHSREVSKYTRMLCLNYGMFLAVNEVEVCLSKEFFRNIFFYFADCVEIIEANRKQLPKTHKNGLQKTEYYGMPALDQMLVDKDSKDSSWNQFSEDTDSRFKAIYTPRWSSDPSLGGTSFFRYKDVMVDYGAEHKDMYLLLRPHPLMFDHMEQTGELSREEAEAYQAKVAEIPNVDFDNGKEYGGTFWQSDALISDYSSIIPEYFITCKPMIFCNNPTDLIYTGTMKRMLEASYCVDNEQELIEALDKLRAGEDPLLEKRKEICQELFGDTLGKSASAILNVLRELD